MDGLQYVAYQLIQWYNEKWSPAWHELTMIARLHNYHTQYHCYCIWHENMSMPSVARIKWPKFYVLISVAKLCIINFWNDENVNYILVYYCTNHFDGSFDVVFVTIFHCVLLDCRVIVIAVIYPTLPLTVHPSIYHLDRWFAEQALALARYALLLNIRDYMLFYHVSSSFKSEPNSLSCNMIPGISIRCNNDTFTYLRRTESLLLTITAYTANTTSARINANKMFTIMTKYNNAVGL